MNSIRTCPVCGNDKFTHRADIQDYSISKETFTLQICNACSFLITNPRPTAEFLPQYYASENYISHSGTRKGFINRLYHIVQRYNLSLKYKAISKYVPRGTWMDYGAGNGAFLEFLKQKSIPVEGFEPDESARNVGAQKGITIHDSAQYTAKKQQYACITMWHVLEHVPELNELIALHHSHLIENGILVIALPNHLSYDAQRYKNFWAAYDVPRHLWHFSEKNITELVTSAGFVHIKTAPLIFDSFYVSMLSEKYRKGNVLKGVWIGMLSNLYARTSGYPFSSQIYVFRKKSI